VNIDWDRLGLGIVVVNLILEPNYDRHAVIQTLYQIAELEELTIVTGRYDLIARFRVSDQRHLRNLVLDRIPMIPSVLRTETMLCLDNFGTDDFASRIFDTFPEGSQREDRVQEMNLVTGDL